MGQYIPKISPVDEEGNPIEGILPQAVELEEALLGALLIEKNAYIDVLDILTPYSFYKIAHRHIYQAIIDMVTSDEPVDLLTVTENLAKKKLLVAVGGPSYITELTSRVASAANIDFHARIVAQKAIARDMITLGEKIKQLGYNPATDVKDLLDYAENGIFNISNSITKQQSFKLHTLIKDLTKQMELAAQSEIALCGLGSGFTELDRLTTGFENGNLIILAARPSMGKTSFALCIARNIAVMFGKSVAFFSLEMSKKEITQRFVTMETGISSEKIKTGKLDNYEWSQFDSTIRPLLDANVTINDTPALSLLELRSECRRLKIEHKIDMIIVDYLQLMSGPKETKANRENEVSTISRGLKSIAKQIDVPLIALSQLNRSVETRAGDKRPQLSDLRESGAIEQDADIVMFIHRPEKYGLTEDEEGNSTRGTAEIIVAKQRNGATGNIKLRFKNSLTKFEDYEDSFNFMNKSDNQVF